MSLPHLSLNDPTTSLAILSIQRRSLPSTVIIGTRKIKGYDRGSRGERRRDRSQAKRPTVKQQYQ